LRLLFFIPEDLSSGFGLSKRGGHGFNLVLPLVEVGISIGGDGFDGVEVLAVLVVGLLLEEVVLVDGAGGDY
jgi:hypothetical protein